MNSAHPEEPTDGLESLFAATSADAPLPDHAALAVLRERSADEFAKGGHVPGRIKPDGDHRTTLFPLRALMALAATAAVLMAGFFISRLANRASRPVADLTFGEVMRNLAKTDSYQAQLIESGSVRMVWASRDSMRVETTPTNYVIAHKQYSWLVDETDNRATLQSDSYYSSDLQAIDPLRLIDIWENTIIDARPTGKSMENGREFVLFQCRPRTKGDYELFARVDSRSGLPVSLKATAKYRTQTIELGELHFTAFNQPLDASKLNVPATLTADGRIGKVIASQGNVALRPLTSTRWTPVCGDTPLRPGDWLRTDFQGANAITIELAPQTTLILGPGSLVELKKPDQITLHSGFAEISPSPKAGNFSGIVKVVGAAVNPRAHAGNDSLEVASATLVQATDNGLVTADQPPAWLAAYKGTAVRESLGSLIATIDGRRVPLTVGYHKVSVEIRDQIARTTIEESFVNHTGGVLEGQFHFPLPADASISGFGMWVGDRLVEADIVEKQRAREIYETILREKRDPGLLEWTGGNLFKARVYPIPAGGEKRIKIVYTQVLPKKGDTYRYSYALQSDLLQQNPLRQLDLDVTIASTQSLTDVTCPTHQARKQVSEHAARVEFSAQNYTPTRDFEVVVDTSGPYGMWKPEVAFIPHQRGDDGYFLLQLQPPGDDGAWQRDVLPDDRPLDLLVLADTSASMDASSRKVQADALASLLGSLAPQDTFNLAVCDVDCTWAFTEPQKAEEKSVAAARELVAKRRSLGWTNLDRAFESIAERVKPGMKVVYLGDGIVTADTLTPALSQGEREPANGPAFVQRLQRLFGGKGATLHAVATSSSYDAAVLRSIASIGGGSLRQVSGQVGPQQTAKDLLAEITRPTLRNIQLQFSGVRTARVYPRVLPNVPLGTQQIVLGRYQPLATEQEGEVVVSGTLEGKLVSYRTALKVPGTEYAVRSTVASSPQPPAPSSDASFIPRLWARLHLDELLAQGTSQDIQNEIINLSEEFHLITPYTSLLVLESEADRERFKVKRRFQMSDGERFFADARDTAQYRLVQQQMQQAGLWRLGLRESVLDSLAGLGRDREQIEALEAVHNVGDLVVAISDSAAPQSWSDVRGPGSLRGFSSNLSLVVSQTQGSFGGESLGFDYGGMGGLAGHPIRGQSSQELLSLGDGTMLGTSVYPIPAPLVLDPSPNRLYAAAAGETMAQLQTGQKAEWWNETLSFSVNGGDPFELDGGSWDVDYDADRTFVGRFLGKALKLYGQSERRKKLSIFSKDRFEHSARHGPSLPTLFPIGLAPPAALPQPPPERKSPWSDEAQGVAGLVRQSIDLAKLEGAIVVHEQHDSYDEHRGRIDSRASSWRLVSAKAWLAKETSDQSGPTIEWAAAGERGVLSVPYELALVRKSAATDFSKEYRVGEWWQGDLVRLYSGRLARVERAQEGQTLLILSEPLRPEHESRILIDEARGIALSIEHFQHGRSQGGSRASDFIEIAGVWVAQKIEHFGAEGRNNNVVTRKFEVVAADRIAGLIDEQLALRAKALTLNWPLPQLHAAKDKAAAGQAAIEDRLRLLVDLAADQKWSEATAELTRCEQMIGPDKHFAVWLRLWLLSASRRHEELKLHLFAQAESLAENPRPGELVLASHLIRAASDPLSPDERLALLDILKPVYARLPEHMQGPRVWAEQRYNLLDNADRPVEATALLRELIRDWPNDSANFRTLAHRLASQGDYEAAYELLQSALQRKEANWPPAERDQLYGSWADLLAQQGRYAEQATLVADWLTLAPTDSGAYERYLAALLYTRREAEADKLIAEWLAGGLVPEPLDEATLARTQAAIETALGDNSYLRGGDPAPQFVAGLAKLVEHLVEREDGQPLVSQIDNDWELRKREEFRLLGQRLAARLKEQAGNMAAARLERLVSWALSHAEGMTGDDWRMIAAAIRQQWQNAPHPAIRESYAGTLVRVLARVGETEKLAFLREQLAKSDEEHRAAHARALFDALLEAEWSAEIETESLALIDQLSPGSEPAGRLRDQVTALYLWTDRMEAARYERLEEAIEHPDKLTSSELEARRAELRRQVRGDLAGRLKTAADGRQGDLRDWLRVEQLFLQARLESDPSSVADSVWELIGPARPAADPVAEGQAPRLADELAAALRSRLVTMLIGLAARKDAPAGEIERLHKYLDQEIAADPAERGPLDARLAKYVLLVALDRPQELAERLQAWSARGARGLHWQRTLAYLKAELGQLDEAIALMQPLVAEDGLDAADYRMLAAWHQAQNHDDQHAAMQVAAWKQLDEWRLRDFVQMHLRPWQNTEGTSPGAIDPQVFLALQALFEKASDPGDHVYLVRGFYEKSRDFRLLAALADAVVGHSSGNIYRFLKECETVLDELDREATAVELLAHLAKVRERATTPVDRRALDLLELLAERRAAELQNQPGPHVDAAVAALQRATKDEWSPGEPRLFAQLLADLGQIQQGLLAAERLRVIRQLHESAAGSPGRGQERLAISHALARSLRIGGQRQQAIDALESALAEHLAASAGQRTSAALDSLWLLVELYAGGGQFVRAEQVLRDELARPANPSVAMDMTIHLFGVHISAVQQHGATSLGAGEALYQAARDELIAAALATSDQGYRRRLVEQLCRLFAVAQESGVVATAGADAVAFGRGPFVLLMERQVEPYQFLVQEVGGTIRRIAGPHEALAFYLARIENEPSWLARKGEDGWREFGDELAQLAHHEDLPGRLGELEPRLLAVVLRALRKELLTQDYHRRALYHDDHSYFWKEKAEDFASAAEEVLAADRENLRLVAYVADYLYSGLSRKDRAIAVLLDARRRGLLDDDGRSRLVGWLQEEKRFGESIALLEPLVQAEPNELRYRTQLMHAYFQTKQPQALQALLAATDKQFHEEGRWSESVTGQLAASCLENLLLPPAVEYLNEAIGRREEALNQQTTGDPTLAQYYVERAYAHAGLGHTKAAVDDAAAAIVVRGAAGDGIARRNVRTGRHEGNVHPIDVLQEVLEQAAHLDAYVADLDREVAAAGQDRPIVRQAIGEVYFERRRFDRALAQFKMAVELAPSNAAIHSRLVECYDALMRPDDAADQVFAAAELARRDVDLWVQLAQRLESLEQPQEAERARTSLVEMLPGEMEGHAKLAEIRQGQGRWEEAIEHWRHVARLRKLEPAGLLGLAAAQIHEGQRSAAEDTLKELETTAWPERFRKQLREEQLPKLQEELAKRLKQPATGPD